MANKERNSIIAMNIKSLLKLKKVTQKELALAIGISPSTLSDYMNLRSNPSHGVIQKIADYFEVSKSDIDSTFKDSESKIERIYSLLSPERKDRVINFAEFQLEEQNKKVLPLITEEIDTLAAHSNDPNKEFTPEEIDGLKAYLNQLSEEYDKKHK